VPKSIAEDLVVSKWELVVLLLLLLSMFAVQTRGGYRYHCCWCLNLVLLGWSPERWEEVVWKDQ
jgi:hypothetical protein